MKRMIPLAVLMIMLLCGFGPGGGDDAPVPEPEKPEGAATDSTDMMIEMYTNGTVKAQYWVQVHAEPKAGQYWETSSESYGTRMTQRWNVAKVEGKCALVEWQMKMDSEYAVSDYVIAFLVDLEGEMGSANVLQAWIGRPGKEATEIEIMDPPEAVEDPAEEGAEPDYEITEEEFKDLEVNDAKWSGTSTTYKGDGFTFKTWIAKDGWFNALLKQEMDGNVSSVLTAHGSDGKQILKWDVAELAKIMKKPAKPAEDKDPETGPEKTPEKTPEKGEDK